MWPALEIAPRSILSVIKALKSAAGWLSQIYSALHKFRGIFTTALAGFASLPSLLDGASRGDAAGSAGRFSFWAFFFHFILFFQEGKTSPRRPPTPSRRPVRKDEALALFPPAGPGAAARGSGCPDGGSGVLTAHRRAATLRFSRVGCLAGIARGYLCAEDPRLCARCADGASRLRGCGELSRAHAPLRLPTAARVGPLEVPGGRGSACLCLSRRVLGGTRAPAPLAPLQAG